MKASHTLALCPKCKSTRVQRSHRRGLPDQFFSLLGGQVRRCHDCRERHVGFQYVTVPLGIGQFNVEKAAAFALAASLAICLIAAWIMIQRLNLPAG